MEKGQLSFTVKPGEGYFGKVLPRFVTYAKRRSVLVIPDGDRDAPQKLPTCIFKEHCLAKRGVGKVRVTNGGGGRLWVVTGTSSPVGGGHERPCHKLFSEPRRRVRCGHSLSTLPPSSQLSHMSGGATTDAGKKITLRAVSGEVLYRCGAPGPGVNPLSNRITPVQV